MILKDDVDIDSLFTYFDELDQNKFDICQLYRIIIESLVDNLENENKFKFILPISDNDIWIHLKEKKNILKRECLNNLV
jgi:hypothetical protein